MKLGTAEIIPHMYKIAMTSDCQTILNSAFSISINPKTLQYLQDKYNAKLREDYFKKKNKKK